MVLTFHCRGPSGSTVVVFHIPLSRSSRSDLVVLYVPLSWFFTFYYRSSLTLGVDWCQVTYVFDVMSTFLSLQFEVSGLLWLWPSINQLVRLLFFLENICNICANCFSYNIRENILQYVVLLAVCIIVLCVFVYRGHSTSPLLWSLWQTQRNGVRITGSKSGRSLRTPEQKIYSEDDPDDRSTTGRT